MGRRVRVSDTVGPDQPAAPEDLGQVRWALSHLGAYDPASDDSPWADDRLSFLPSAYAGPSMHRALHDVSAAHQALGG